MDRDGQGLSRREFLERTAYGAGLAGVAASLPAGTILAQAAEAAARRSGLPDPRNVPIDHFVIVMMENRSFDHYFGWVPGADAIQQQSFPDPSGKQVPTRHASTLGAAQWQGCGYGDPGHGWDSGRAQLEGGFMADGAGNDEFALTYYNEGELGFIHEAARQFTLYDRFHCSLLTSTWPNRYYKWSAQSGGKKNNDPPVDTLGNQWETIFDRALGKGLTARYYNSDLPFSATFGPRAIPWTQGIVRYYVDCAAGTLPNVSIVDPPFRDGGGFDGNSADEHPLGDVRLGQAFMADVVRAFVESPNYRRGALFVVYDEWGGFFDHVRPPSVPDDRQSSNLNDDFGQMGFRIPAVAVSPYARPKGRRDRFRVDHGLYGFESILKLITYRFGLGDLVKRDAMARNIGLSFDWNRPDFEAPELPDPAHIASKPCTVGGGDVVDPEQAHENDLAALEDLADRFGFEVGDGAPHELFTQPDKLQRALAGSK
jgi:phospholipase C